MQPEILGLQSTSTTADRANPLSERATGVLTSSTLASWVLLIARALQQQGIDPEPLFRRAGLPSSQVHDANARYPLAALQRLWHLAAQATGDPCFGLEVGRLWHPTTFQALGYAALASASLRDALASLVRYCHVVSTGVVLQLVDRTDEVDLVIASRGPDPLGSAAGHATQAAMAAVVTLCRQARSGTVLLHRVTLTRYEREAAARLEAFFGCPVASGTQDALVFGAHELDAPLATFNHELLRLNREHVAQYLAGLEASDVSGQVRLQIARLLPAGLTDAGDVAQALHMSRRTLQRKLQLQDTSFRRLLDETRRDLARQYLHDVTLSMAEVASLLGFTETSSLSRAMRRWRAPEAHAAD
jgi:AraC-like DNA-binding protein